MKEIEDDSAFHSWKCVSNVSLLFCTSNIQDQVSFVRASIMRKSYREVSVKLGIEGVVYRSILSPLSKKRKNILTIFYVLKFSPSVTKFLSTWKERMIK